MSNASLSSVDKCYLTTIDNIFLNVVYVVSQMVKLYIVSPLVSYTCFLINMMILNQRTKKEAFSKSLWLLLYANNIHHEWWQTQWTSNKWMKHSISQVLKSPRKSFPHQSHIGANLNSQSIIWSPSFALTYSLSMHRVATTCIELGLQMPHTSLHYCFDCPDYRVGRLELQTLPLSFSFS